MADSQLLTLAMAIILPLSMLIYSNSRITEAKETLRAAMNALRAEINVNLERISRQIADLSNQLKLHEIEHHK